MSRSTVEMKEAVVSIQGLPEHDRRDALLALIAIETAKQTDLLRSIFQQQIDEHETLYEIRDGR